MSESDSLVTLATFSTPEELHVVKSALEAAGIHAVAYDEQIVGSLWHVGIALGGVKLLVKESDLPSADKIMQDSREASSAEAEAILAWVCPRCGEEVDAGFGVCWSCGTLANSTGGLAAMPVCDALPTAEQEEIDAFDDKLPLSREQAKGMLSGYIFIAYGTFAIILLIALLENFRFGAFVLVLAALYFGVKRIVDRSQPEE